VLCEVVLGLGTGTSLLHPQPIATRLLVSLESYFSIIPFLMTAPCQIVVLAMLGQGQGGKKEKKELKKRNQ
jgi:hypothetical protein